jgi:hypothetical protein
MSDSRAGAGAAAALLALVAACGGDEPRALVEVPSRVARYDVAEVALLAGTDFDPRSGSPSPFDDVRLEARVQAPDGRSFQVEGFFAGDALGGLAGDVFRLRIAPDQPGRWSFETQSDLAPLDGLKGEFECAGEIAGPFARGPLEIDPAEPRRFRYRDGPPVFLLGKFLDESAPPRIGFSHTFLSERVTDAEREAMIERAKAIGANKLNLYIANREDYGVPTTPWLGTLHDSDPSTFDLGRWRRYDHWLRRLRDEGIAAHVWFFADDSDFRSLELEHRERLLRYGMARLSAHVNTVFVLALEWEESFSIDETEQLGRFLQAHNPWRRLVSVHGRPGDFDFPGADWADYMELQTGFGLEPERVHALVLSNRALAAKPLLAEEFTRGAETDTERARTWAAYLAAPAGLGTGAGMAAVSRFAAAFPPFGLEPAGERVRDGSAFASAEPGRRYLAYLYDGDELALDLADAEGPLRARWYDPRSGAFAAPFPIEGGEVREFTAPGPGDWVLAVDRP